LSDHFLDSVLDGFVFPIGLFILHGGCPLLLFGLHLVLLDEHLTLLDLLLEALDVAVIVVLGVILI
jgi:hypothetical protein